MLSEKIRALEEQEKQIVSEMQSNLTSEYAYVTYQDIKSCFGNQVVIAVKAPPESKLEVSEQLQIWLKSECGPIEVYLCQNYQQNANETPMNNNTSSNTIIGNTYHTTNSQPDPQQPLTSQTQAISSDEGRGTFNTEQYDPIFSSALSISEDEDTLRFLPVDNRDDYNFCLDEDYTTSSLFPDDNLGLD